MLDLTLQIWIAGAILGKLIFYTVGNSSFSVLMKPVKDCTLYTDLDLLLTTSVL